MEGGDFNGGLGGVSGGGGVVVAEELVRRNERKHGVASDNDESGSDRRSGFVTECGERGACRAPRDGDVPLVREVEHLG